MGGVGCNWSASRKEGDDGREEAGGVDHEAPTYAGCIDHNGSDGRTYNSGDVYECGVESDGIADQSRAHEFGYQRLTRRVVGGAQDSKG
jgi:hypothetical protein